MALNIKIFEVHSVSAHSAKFCIPKVLRRKLLSSFSLLFDLKLCFILEPMQELMSRHKTYNMNPRGECVFKGKKGGIE